MSRAAVVVLHRLGGRGRPRRRCIVATSFDLAQQIVTVLGEPIGFTAVVDVEAIAAARLALVSRLAVPVTAGVDAWRERWARIGLVDDAGRVVPGKEADLLIRAGRAARLTRRPSSVDFEAGLSASDLAESLGAAGLDYALTGDAGANLYGSSAGEAWPVVYVADIDPAAEAGGLVREGGRIRREAGHPDPLRRRERGGSRRSVASSSLPVIRSSSTLTAASTAWPSRPTSCSDGEPHD